MVKPRGLRVQSVTLFGHNRRRVAAYPVAEVENTNFGRKKLARLLMGPSHRLRRRPGAPAPRHGHQLREPSSVVAEQLGVGRAQAGASESPGGDLAKLPQRRPRRRNACGRPPELPAPQGQSQDKGRSCPRGGPSRLPRAERHRPPPGGPTPRPGVAPTVTPHDHAGTLSGGRMSRGGPGATGMSLIVPPASWNSPAAPQPRPIPSPSPRSSGGRKRHKGGHQMAPDNQRQRQRDGPDPGPARAPRGPPGCPTSPRSTSGLPARTARPW